MLVVEVRYFVVIVVERVIIRNVVVAVDVFSLLSFCVCVCGWVYVYYTYMDELCVCAMYCCNINTCVHHLVTECVKCSTETKEREHE